MSITVKNSNQKKFNNKTLLFTIAFGVFTLLGFSQESIGRNITITIDNIKSNNGKVVLGLHTEDTFMKGPGVQKAESNVTDGKITITFKDVKPGVYAIMALHDENENNRMDFDASGMPQESYGMSNNPLSYGPPQYNDAKFEVTTEDLDLKIRF